MNTRELLEAAANRMGYSYTYILDHASEHPFLIVKELDNKYWNPLQRNEDAFRLAVERRLMVDIGVTSTRCISYDNYRNEVEVAHDSLSPIAATRRAIVLCVALVKG